MLQVQYFDDILHIVWDVVRQFVARDDDGHAHLLECV